MRIAPAVLCVLCLAGVSVAVADCDCDQPGNLIPNCGFDTDGSSWISIFGTNTFNPDDDCPSAEGGSLQVEGELFKRQTSLAAVGLDQRVTIDPNTTYSFGGAVKLVTALGGWVYSDFILQEYSADGSTLSHHMITQTITQGGWQGWLTETFTSHPDAQSVGISIWFEGGLDPSIVLNIDELFLGPGLVPVELQSFEAE